VAHHKIKNGEIIEAGRLQVAVDSFFAKNEPTILRVLDATTRFFLKIRARPVLMLLSRLLGAAIPTGEVVTTRRAIDFIDAISARGNTEIAVGPCLCQKALGKRNGTYMKDMTILYGVEAYRKADPSYKDLSPDEAKALLRKFQEEGLMPTFYSCFRSGGWIYAICNCEGKICFPFRAHQAAGAVMYRGPDIVSVNSEECIGCGWCVDRCHFGANTLVNGTCQVDLAKCYGCGVCVPTCKAEARKMIERAGYRPRYYPVELVNKAAA
jgi:NAD-dependent dihydropyrimidine dehydrogenase PreA subunit